MVRRNDLFLGKAEGTDEAFTQLGQEVEGTAQKGNIAPYGLSAGKAADGLVHHCLENGRGQVFPGSAFINQWLYIRFGKYAAASRDWIDGLVMGGVFVEAAGIGLKQGGHLVDKGTRAACTDPVHPLVNPAGKVYDFCILAAKLNGHICLGRIVLQGRGHRHHLLDKWNAQMGRQGKASGSRDHGNDLGGAGYGAGLFQKSCQSFLYIGIMTLIIGEYYMVVLIKQCYFDGCGTDIDSQRKGICM